MIEFRKATTGEAGRVLENKDGVTKIAIFEGDYVMEGPSESVPEVMPEVITEMEYKRRSVAMKVFQENKTNESKYSDHSLIYEDMLKESDTMIEHMFNLYGGYQDAKYNTAE